MSYTKISMQFWTPERVELLIKFWERGWTAKQCAERLNAVSRNAVIGKVDRLGLSKRENPYAEQTMRLRLAAKRRAVAARRALAKAKAALKAKHAAKPKPTAPAEIKAQDAFQALDNVIHVPFSQRAPKTCCWPIDGEPDGEMQCCGQELDPHHKSYCPTHRWLSAPEDRRTVNKS